MVKTTRRRVRRVRSKEWGSDRNEGEKTKTKTKTKKTEMLSKGKGRVLPHSRVDELVRRSPLCDELLALLEDFCVARFFAAQPGVERETVATDDVAIVAGL